MVARTIPGSVVHHKRLAHFTTGIFASVSSITSARPIQACPASVRHVYLASDTGCPGRAARVHRVVVLSISSRKYGPPHTWLEGYRVAFSAISLPRKSICFRPLLLKELCHGEFVLRLSMPASELRRSVFSYDAPKIKPSPSSSLGTPGAAPHPRKPSSSIAPTVSRAGTASCTCHWRRSRLHHATATQKVKSWYVSGLRVQYVFQPALIA
jgi:hypothetical protein